MARQRRRFRAHGLHHVAIAANSINVVAEDLEVGTVVAAGEPGLGNGHADAGGDPLPKRSGRGFDPRYKMVLGVTWSLAAELAEAANIVERNRGLPKPFVLGIHRAGAGEMEHRP